MTPASQLAEPEGLLPSMARAACVVATIPLIISLLRSGVNTLPATSEKALANWRLKGTYLSMLKKFSTMGFLPSNSLKRPS